MKQRNLLITIAVGGAVFAFAGDMRAALWLPHSLSDHVLFQQSEPILLWGRATPGAEINAELTDDAMHAVGRRGNAKTDEGGHWRIEWDSLSASFSRYSITISGDGETKTVRDVLIGELWLTGGQSNMHLPVRYMIEGDKMMRAASNDNVRIFQQRTVDETWRKGVAPTPQEDTPDGHWLAASSEQNVAECSAVAYSFAVSLFAALNTNGHAVPVGVMNTAVGATGILSWMSREAMESDAELRAKFPASWNTGDWKDYHQPWSQPTALFNHKIAPLANHAVRGFLWYQGEADGSLGEAGAGFYRKALTTLIDDWRRHWGGKPRPFILSQLHAYDKDGKMPADQLDSWAYLREAQFDAAQARMPAAAIPNYDLALTWNVGGFAYKSPIHPLDKKPLGERMTLAARALTYGEHVSFQGPVFDHLSWNSNRLVIHFRHDEGLNSEGGQLAGFAICGPDRRFVKAEAKIVAGTVEVTSPEVTQPVAVTYAFTSQNHCANLYNRQKLPAVPFRSDRIKSEFLKYCPCR